MKKLPKSLLADFGGALAPKPPRATSAQPESLRQSQIRPFPKKLSRSPTDSPEFVFSKTTRLSWGFSIIHVPQFIVSIFTFDATLVDQFPRFMPILFAQFWCSLSFLSKSTVQETGQIPGCGFYLPVFMSRNYPVLYSPSCRHPESFIFQSLSLYPLFP